MCYRDVYTQWGSNESLNGAWKLRFEFSGGHLGTSKEFELPIVAMSVLKEEFIYLSRNG